MSFNPGEINGGDGRHCLYTEYDRAEFEAMRGVSSAAEGLILGHNSFS